MARRPACELLPWACECSGQAVSPHPMIFPSTSSWAGIPTLFWCKHRMTVCTPFLSSRPPSSSHRSFLPADPVADTRPGSRFANREEERPQVFTTLGGSRVRLRPPWTPSAAVTADRRRPLFSLSNFSLPLTALFHPIFSKVCSRHGGRGWDGSRPSGDEGWGGRRQFRFDANDLCTIQGQRMICEACAPTHASIHNLVLDYISI